MRLVHEETLLEELEFARRAAKHFAAEPKHASFTSGEIEPGCLIALRWGLGNDCVLVLKLDEFHEPTIYGEIVRQFQVPARSGRDTSLIPGESELS